MIRPRLHLVHLLCLATLALVPQAPARAAVKAFDGAWSALDPGAAAPSPRREYAAIYDVQRDRYLIFAGFGVTSSDSGYITGYVWFNEIWTLTLGATPQWGQLEIAGPVPGERQSPQWGYDPARQRLLVFGGYGHHYPGGPNEYLNDVWELALDGTPAWTELHPTGTAPTGRLAGSSIYDPLRQRFVGFGGTVGLPVDTWSLDLAGDPAWTPILTDTTSPTAGYGKTTIYDPVRDRMLLFGGSTSDQYFGTNNDVWELALAGAPAWHKLAPLDTPPIPRRSMSSIYDPLRDRMVVYGGWDGNSDNLTSFLGDTWALSLADLRWSELAPSGNVPIGRDATAAAYDAAADRLVVYGGWSGNTMLSDTHFLTWGQPAVAATLTPQAQADPGLAQVHWDIQNATGRTVGVYRRQAGTPWSSIATAQSDPSGAVSFADHGVAAGGSYAYQLAVSSQSGVVFGGEVWVNVPGSTTVPPQGTLALALRPVRPNPVQDRFVVSFDLPSAAAARIEVVDLAGRRLAEREVGSLGPGSHQVEFGARQGIPPGVCFIRLEQGGRSLTTRAVVIEGAPRSR